MGSRKPSRRNSIEMHMGGHSMHLRRSDTGNLTESSDEGSTPANGEYMPCVELSMCFTN
jgi:hypothetical protein